MEWLLGIKLDTRMAASHRNTKLVLQTQNTALVFDLIYGVIRRLQRERACRIHPSDSSVTKKAHKLRSVTLNKRVVFSHQLSAYVNPVTLLELGRVTSHSTAKPRVSS